MRIRVDLESDALYFRVSEEAIEESEEIAPGLVADYDHRGRVVGLEFLNVKERFTEEELSSLKVELPTVGQK